MNPRDLRPLVLAAALLLPLAACSDAPEESTEDRFAAAAAACPRLAEIQRDFGASIGGTYGEATLLEYRISGSRSAAVVAAPNDSACAGDIAGRLQDACDLCQNQPGSCLALVTGVFSIPTAACTYCGDDICSVGQETLESCPADCTCGNGLCDGTFSQPESTLSCPVDCGGTCGDGYCASPLEACLCDPDSGAPCEVCEQDCCVARCGDGRCDIAAGEATREAPSFCENDCGGGGCGDGVCQPFESTASCPADCRDFLRCDPSQPPNQRNTPNSCATDADCGLSACGDGYCQDPETCYNCPEDCNITFTQTLQGGSPVCFDGVCSACEVATCQADCAGVAFDCGNGVCDDGELPINCPQDCPWDTCTQPACRSNYLSGVCNDELPPVPLACTDAACGERCGDGLCGPSERAATCPEDCTSCRLYRGEAMLLPVCVADEVTCGRMQLEGVWTDVVFDCGQRIEGCPSRPAMTPCDGRCSPTLDGAVCVDCPNPGADPTQPMSDAERAERERPRPLCGETFIPYCAGPQRAQTCVIDPDYSDDPACAIVDGAVCTDRCAEGVGCLDAPRITGQAPRFVVPGDAWTLLGINLGALTGRVLFGDGQPGSILSWGEQRVEVLLPPTATSGPVVLERADGATATIELAVPEGPAINAFLPAGGSPGDPLRIVGVHFGDTPGELSFVAHPRTNMPSVAATVTAWSDTAVEVIIPEDANNGPVTLRTAAGLEVQSEPVTVYTPLVVINSVEPPAARPGDTIRIHGRYLPPDPKVTFGSFNLTGQILSRTPELIEVVVPPGTTTQVTLTVSFSNGGNPQSYEYFYTLPTIEGVRSCQSQVTSTVYAGEPLSLFGTELPQGSFEVIFPPGLSMRAASNADRTSADFLTVPQGAQSGPLRIVIAEGVEVMTAPLTVLGPAVDPGLPYWPMPDSETAYCINDTAAISCASAAGGNYDGQDGQRRAPLTTYTRQGNLTTDSLTGLQWTELSAQPTPWATAACTCLRGSFGGQTGWRLPSAVEVVSLMDMGAGRYQGVNLPDATLWTHELNSANRNNVWTASFADGVNSQPRMGPFSALCVRSTTAQQAPPERYTLTADTALDTTTGLMWQRANDATPRLWNQSMFQCAQETTGGFEDWRLPTFKELMTIIDRSREQPAFDPEIFTGLGRGDFWTSTPTPEQTRQALVINTETGGNNSGVQIGARALRVCVRGG